MRRVAWLNLYLLTLVTERDAPTSHFGNIFGLVQFTHAHAASQSQTLAEGLAPTAGAFTDIRQRLALILTAMATVSCCPRNWL